MVSDVLGKEEAEKIKSAGREKNFICYKGSKEKRPLPREKAQEKVR